MSSPAARRRVAGRGRASGRCAQLRGVIVGFVAALGFAGALGLAGGGCSPSDDSEASAPVAAAVEPVADTEGARARAACRDYIDAVCACAEARPEDADIQADCDMAGAKLSGVNMLLELNRSTAADDERAKSAHTLRRYARSCIEARNALAVRGCPRE
ncbi:MAG: hypothetical protein Tsb0020_38520 [Haliangiales bacterium]